VRQTYLNSPQLKADFLAEITKHEAQDALIKGTYGQMNGTFKGCAIGCSLHSLNVLQGKTGAEAATRTGDHARYETELGLPIWFAHLEDYLFENLSDDLARTWPRRLAEAIPVGAVIDDLVLAKILRWLLADETYGVRYTTDDEAIRGHIDGVIAGFDAEIATGGHASADQREAAARAAWDAGAAWDARAAWAARDAWDAGDAWAARAAWAAWAAGDAGAAGAARAARAARDARAAGDAWAARAAGDARDARAAGDAWAAAAFYPALADYVRDLVRALPNAPAVTASQGSAS